MGPVEQNLVVIGAGPGGLAAGTLIKALNPAVKVTMIDKRVESKRNHGLSIEEDAIAKIRELLQQAMESSPSEPINRALNTFEKWSGRVIRTREIEALLTDLANSMGIDVIRDPDFGIYQGDLHAALSRDEITDLNEHQMKLRDLLQSASVIIAADGAHSDVRQELNIPVTDKENLRYMVEFKYQTAGHTVPRGNMEAVMIASKTGHVATEIMNRHNTEETKTGTYLVFVDQEAYEALRPVSEDGKIKGTYGNVWTLMELQEFTRNDRNLQRVYRDLQMHAASVQQRGGSCDSEQIVTLELAIYRAERSVENFHGKYFVITGDANSGLVLQRGFNKALQEAALCAKTVTQFFQDPTMDLMRDEERNLPEIFIEYERDTQKLFAAERSLIYSRDRKIAKGQFFAGSTASSFAAIDDSMEFSSMVSETTARKVGKISDVSITSVGTDILSFMFGGFASMFSSDSKN